ncbi:Redoxin [Rhizodiscina lignyota]|uniref:Thioredoxin peroxidase n=1 Tax=Rhizodiscina lignyota TaxID=1504668 RepID=A0A9P4I4V6_9PEZI|nr:Redoxin [Rhizodiscina lignyota]
MAPLQVGDKFPDGVVFTWAPYADLDATACGRPEDFNASEAFKGKKVVLVSVPGAFTPGCQALHLPPYIQKLDELSGKGVDMVVVIASNDAWVMSAWGKVNQVSGDSKIKFMSDTKTFFSKSYAWSGMGDRNGRWAMVIDDGVVKYADADTKPGTVTVSGVDAVLAKL